MNDLVSLGRSAPRPPARRQPTESRPPSPSNSRRQAWPPLPKGYQAGPAIPPSGGVASAAERESAAQVLEQRKTRFAEAHRTRPPCLLFHHIPDFGRRCESETRRSKTILSLL